MNLTLIGMAGAGKTYLGAKLSKGLGLRSVDSDVLLSDAYGGRDIQGILDELGEKEYLATEARICIENTLGCDGLLLSPSGSVVYTDKWVDHLRNISTVIYLKVPFETIETRLEKVPPRAIIGLGRKTLRELYDERHPLYESAANLIIGTHGRDTDKVARMILDFLKLSER